MTAGAHAPRTSRAALVGRPTGPAAPAEPVRTAQRPPALATRASVVLLVVVLLVQYVVPGGWGGASWIVLAVGLLAGLPHGAVDHVVPALVLGERAPRLVLVVVGYAAVAALSWTVFQTSPVVALVAFTALSVLHFGTGEVAFDAERAGRRLRRDPVAVVATGGAPLLLPIACHRAAVAPVIAVLVPGSSGLLPATVCSVTAAVVVAAVAWTAVRRLEQHRVRGAAEVLLLALVSMVVPPLAAFGAYFGGWHSLRHVSRLVEADARNGTDLADGRLLRPLGRFAARAALPTVASGLALLGLWALAGGWRGFVAADLALLAGLTVPHALVVTWWERSRLLPRERTGREGSGRPARRWPRRQG